MNRKWLLCFVIKILKSQITCNEKRLEQFALPTPHWLKNSLNCLFEKRDRLSTCLETYLKASKFILADGNYSTKRKTAQFTQIQLLLILFFLSVFNFVLKLCDTFHVQNWACQAFITIIFAAFGPKKKGGNDITRDIAAKPPKCVPESFGRREPSLLQSWKTFRKKQEVHKQFLKYNHSQCFNLYTEGLNHPKDTKKT